MFSNMDIVLNNFCCEYVDDNNCFAVIMYSAKIEFSVSQRKYGNKSFSKITAIKVISDKE